MGRVCPGAHPPAPSRAHRPGLKFKAAGLGRASRRVPSVSWSRSPSACPECRAGGQAGSDLQSPRMRNGEKRRASWGTRQQVAEVPGWVWRAGKAEAEGHRGRSRGGTAAAPTLRLCPAPACGPSSYALEVEGLTVPSSGTGSLPTDSAGRRLRPRAAALFVSPLDLQSRNAHGPWGANASGRCSFGNEMCAMPALLSVLTLGLPLCYLWR